MLKISLLSISLLIILATVCITAYVLIVASSAHLDRDRLSHDARYTRVLDYTGEPIDNGGDYASLDEIPNDLVNAFVAVEDKRFYQHNGLDYRRITGALVANLKSKNAAQGASTITCQLIKNTHLTQEKTIKRKIKEAKLALELEKAYDKEDILEMYLNVIYLGGGCYGVKSAAHSYFGKEPQDLTLVECASIAATTVNPSLYSPRRNEQNNLKRRNMVLTLMEKQGFISQEQAEDARNTTLSLKKINDDIYETYRINAIDEAARLTGLDVKQLADGYSIFTYCDPRVQQKAYNAINRQAAKDNVDYMALYASTSGEIKGFCSNFDNAESAIRRQIGSTIKPFVYASAIEQNLLLPDSILLDEPRSFGDYTPHNYHDVYYGKVAARDALAHSANVAAVKTLEYAGLERTFGYIMDCGLPLHNKDKHLGLALGGLTYGCTMDELATAYCTLAAGGIRHTAAFVDKVTDPDGKVVYRREQHPERVMKATTAYLVTDMLTETVRTGTARKLGELDTPLAAKTGTVESTTGGNSDAWCVAYTAGSVAISWAGNLSMDKARMHDISGGGFAATMVKTILSGEQGVQFTRPDGVKSVDIDGYTYDRDGTIALASPNTPAKYRRAILASDSYTLSMSTTFEQVPDVDCHFYVDEHGVNLVFSPSAVCSYRVYYDNGFSIELVDEITPPDNDDTIKQSYDLLVGWWSVVPVLHGKTDIVGQEAKALIL